MLLNLLHEGLEEPYRNVIGPVVIVAVLGEVSLNLVVCYQSGFIPDGLDLGVLDGGQRVDYM